MRSLGLRRFFVLIGVAGAFALMSGERSVSGQSSNPCGMQLNSQPVIFCDTFDYPHAVTNRSGQLDGTIWGVSRMAGSGPRWNQSTLDGCNGPQAASPVNATDVIVCGGRLRQSQDDNHDVTVMAMYPKQPFDFAGRTGTVSFDVSNDTTGSHGSWPEFWLTDLPVPAPSVHLIPCDMCSVPRNGFGIRFSANDPKWRADSIVIVRDYIMEDRNIFENNSTGTRIVENGQVGFSPGPNGGLNHVELRISQNRIEVYATEPGQTQLKLINTITNANLPLSKGLIWVGDYHYAAEKAHAQTPSLPNQQNHTYAWDNVAFDGPATYRDLSYDVLDNTQPDGNALIKVGWDTTPSSAANLNTLPMASSAIAAATKAYLMFNYNWRDNDPTTFNFTINGTANSEASPFPAPSVQLLRGARTVAFQVPKSQLVNGPQNIKLNGNLPFSVQNVNIVLVAATSVPGAGPSPSTPTNVRILQ